jgi:ATP synthase I subunit
MTPTTFLVCVTRDSAVALGVVTIAATWLAGPRVGLGVLAGGALAVGNLWWLASRIVSRTSGAGVAGWALTTVLRLAATGAAVLLVLATGLAHPVGLVLGLTILPFALIARGLATAREA